MIRRIKNYYFKTNWDCTHGYIDPLEYHSTFYFFLCSFHAANRPSGFKLYWNRNLYFLCAALFAVTLSLISFGHGVYTLDLYLVTESGSYGIVLSYNIVLLYCARFNYENYQYLLKAMKDDFMYICTNPSAQKHRTKFFNLQLDTWKFSIMSVIITFATSVGMILFALLQLGVFLITRDPALNEPRPSPFPAYLPGMDFLTTPFYEIIFVLYAIISLGYSFNFVFQIQTQIVWVGHIATQVEMVTWSLEDLFEEIKPAENLAEREYYDRLIKKKMKHIVSRHQEIYSLIENWIAVYKKLLMCEQKIYPSVICLTAYCAAEKLDHGELRLNLVWLCLGTVAVYFIPSYLCTSVADKTKTMCFACWDTSFWDASPVVRPYLVIMMLKAMAPLPLSAPGFEGFSLETFFNKMAGAYSTFNMLRRINE